MKDEKLGGKDLTTDFVLSLAELADDCELDYDTPVGEVLRLLVAERDRLRADGWQPIESAKAEYRKELLAALNKAHEALMLSLGRNPRQYQSKYSIAAQAIFEVSPPTPIQESDG